MVGSKCNLKTHVQNLRYPIPYKSGPQNHLLGPTSRPNGNFNGLYLRNETRYRESVKCVDNYKGSPTSSKNVMNFGLQRLQSRPPFVPTLRKFCILLYCQASQMISKRNSTKLCQTVDSKLRQQSAVEKSGSFVPKNWGPKIFNICSVFRRLLDLMATVF